jgi:hypothetical protein
VTDGRQRQTLFSWENALKMRVKRLKEKAAKKKIKTSLSIIHPKADKKPNQKVLPLGREREM